MILNWEVNEMSHRDSLTNLLQILFSFKFPFEKSVNLNTCQDADIRMGKSARTKVRLAKLASSLKRIIARKANAKKCTAKELLSISFPCAKLSNHANAMTINLSSRTVRRAPLFTASKILAQRDMMLGRLDHVDEKEEVHTATRLYEFYIISPIYICLVPGTFLSPNGSISHVGESGVGK